MQVRPRQTWDEFCAELEADKERERKAMASWRVQMREQRPVYKPKWWPILGALLFFGAVGFVIWQVIEALPRFIEAWR